MSSSSYIFACLIAFFIIIFGVSFDSDWMLLLGCLVAIALFFVAFIPEKKPSGKDS